MVGFNVTNVDKQTCCGAIQSHSGELERAKQLAKENINAFENGDFDFIVNSIGGCGAMLVEYDKLEKEKSGVIVLVHLRKTKDISFVLSLVDLIFQKKLQKQLRISLRVIWSMCKKYEPP
ncbi:(Fe-S)-binding protein [Anaerobacillus sp. HL2]|nr:(Fe-S)-binding protein [Anaerobacillus sp. HL2]